MNTTIMCFFMFFSSFVSLSCCQLLGGVYIDICLPILLTNQSKSVCVCARVWNYRTVTCCVYVLVLLLCDIRPTFLHKNRFMSNICCVVSLSFFISLFIITFFSRVFYFTLAISVSLNLSVAATQTHNTLFLRTHLLFITCEILNLIIITVFFGC